MSMTLRKGRVRIDSINDRPDVPPDWLIMNAPRPICGTKEELGYGPEGAFTVAIDPADDMAAWMIKENRGLDACTVLYISDSQLFEIGFAHYAAIASSEGMIANVIKSVTSYDEAIAKHGFDVLISALNRGNDA
jgi:hypothetical protein